MDYTRGVMSPRQSFRPFRRAFLVGLLGLGAPAGWAQDSVTAACRQRPDYCALMAGKEAGAVPVRGGAELASVAATLRLREPDLKLRVERALEQCAEWAEAEVNRRHLGGASPSRQQCQEVLTTKDPCGRTVTRAMQWGSEKHTLALQCTQEKLDVLLPGRFSLEPRYRYDKATGQTRWLTPQEVRDLLRDGCGEELKGTLAPDVVLHAGHPLAATSIYDFKFPCPSTNNSSWKIYEHGHPHQGASQGGTYAEALKTEAALVAPRVGTHQRIRP